MARYIDAGVLIGKLVAEKHFYPAIVARAIDDTPTADVVEVVRCRECNHCEILQDEWDNDWYFCKKTVNNAEVKANDFCSYGERKDVTDINVGDKKE